jgi:hypothetical protein
MRELKGGRDQSFLRWPGDQTDEAICSRPQNMAGRQTGTKGE